MIRIPFSLAPLALLVACSTNSGGSHTSGIVGQHAQGETSSVLDLQQQMYGASSSVSMQDDLWVGGGAIQLTDRDVLPDFFTRSMSVHQPEPVPFQEIVSRLSAEFGTRIVMAPDAIEHLKSSALGSSSVMFTLQHTGSVASILDLVTSKANLFWRWENNQVTLYRHITRTFVIDSLPGQSSFSASVGNASENDSSFSQSTAVTSAPASAWENIAVSVTAMISGDGRFALSEQIGTLTITDTPLVVEEVESYIESINSIMGRKIAVRTEVYEVLLEKDGSLGEEWDRMFRGSGSLAMGSPNLGVNVIGPDSNFNGSGDLIKALSEYTDLSLVTSSSAYTTNGQPVPVQVIDETTYLAARGSQAGADGRPGQSSLTPGVVTSGISMSLLPRVESDGDIMLQVAMDLSQLNGISTFGSGDARIQMPNRSSKSFLQRVSLRSGETLMLSGFERTDTRSGVGSNSGRGLWGLGGDRKIMTIVMVTPYLTPHYNPLPSATVSRENTSNYRSLSSSAVTSGASVSTAQVRQVATPVETATQPEPSLHSCGTEFTFQTGMLRQNLIEVLGICGYSMGAWSLGNDEFMIDFPVRSSFVVNIGDAGLPDVLDAVASVYGVYGAINPLTQSVNFSSASTGEIQ